VIEAYIGPFQCQGDERLTPAIEAVVEKEGRSKKSEPDSECRSKIADSRLPIAEIKNRGQAGQICNRKSKI
jgi:hypothetical protein